MRFAFSRLVFYFLAWIEQRYLRFIQLPHSSLSLAPVTDLARVLATLVI